MQKIHNTVVRYKGFGVHESYCYVDIFKYHNKYLVIMTEPDSDDSGTSVTNACETIATKVLNEYLIDVDVKNIKWIEHYYGGRRYLPESYDFVTFEYDGKEFHSPVWKRLNGTLTEEDLFNIIKGKESESKK